MKKQRSVNLEEVAWTKIEEYQKQYNLASVNTAIEWMLMGFFNTTPSHPIQSKAVEEKVEFKPVEEEVVIDKPKQSRFSTMFDSMPD